LLVGRLGPPGVVWSLEVMAGGAFAPCFAAIGLRGRRHARC
jgi:hypothetical protein